MAAAPQQHKRKFDEDAALQPKREPLYWNKVDLAQVNYASYKRGKFGASGARTYGKDKQPFVVLLPLGELVYEPSCWDDDKAQRYTGESLKSDRKADKWSATLRYTNPAVADFCNRLTKQAREELLATRAQWDTANVYAELTDQNQLMTLVPPLIAKDKDGDGNGWLLKLGMFSDVGATRPAVPFIDHATRAGIDKPVGRGTTCYALVDFSDVFIGQKAKVYATVRAFYVKDLVAPRASGVSDLEPDFTRV